MIATMTETPDPLLTVQEVAQALRLHPETVRRWLADGRLQGRRFASDRAGWRIPRAELDRVLVAHGLPANTPAPPPRRLRPRGRQARRRTQQP
jgi:excisionase family DNA binding protein